MASQNENNGKGQAVTASVTRFISQRLNGGNCLKRTYLVQGLVLHKSDDSTMNLPFYVQCRIGDVFPVCILRRLELEESAIL
jgi:hypothetical protein